MTPGDCGSAEHDAEAISAIRREEARAAAGLIGAEYVCLEFRDLAIFNDDESRRRVTEALRRVAPAIILTAPPSDYIADHEMTSLLVRDACFAASCPNYTTRQWDPALPLAKIPHLYFVQPVEGRDRDGRPVPVDFHIDVSRVFEAKREMLACHASQRNWLMRAARDRRIPGNAGEMGWGCGCRDWGRASGGISPVSWSSLSCRTICCFNWWGWPGRSK